MRLWGYFRKKPEKPQRFSRRTGIERGRAKGRKAGIEIAGLLK